MHIDKHNLTTTKTSGFVTMAGKPVHTVSKGRMAHDIHTIICVKTCTPAINNYCKAKSHYVLFSPLHSITGTSNFCYKSHK